MFLGNMPSEALLKEVKRDMNALRNREENFVNSHHRDLFLAKKYPVVLRTQWKSPLTFNRWQITVICASKKNRDNPEVYHYATYETPQGCGLVYPCYDLNTDIVKVHKFTAHFISRYKTRYLIPNNLYIPGMDTAQYLVDNNNTFYFPDKVNKEQSICCMNGGIALGVEENGVYILRTFISLDMLRQMQERVLRSSIEYQKSLDDFIKNQLPNSYMEYCLQGRIGKVAGPDPIPRLSLNDVKDLLKDKPKIPLYSPLTGKFEMED